MRCLSLRALLTDWVWVVNQVRATVAQLAVPILQSARPSALVVALRVLTIHQSVQPQWGSL
jgi:hypothetical protein